jgi:hypothetical protein
MRYRSFLSRYNFSLGERHICSLMLNRFVPWSDTLLGQLSSFLSISVWLGIYARVVCVPLALRLSVSLRIFVFGWVGRCYSFDCRAGIVTKHCSG